MKLGKADNTHMAELDVGNILQKASWTTEAFGYSENERWYKKKKKKDFLVAQSVKNLPAMQVT